MTLLRAELLRIRSRRLFNVLAMVVIGMIVIVTGWIFFFASGLGFPSSVQIGFRILGDFLFTLSVVVGASAVGAEWGTGGMSTLLTWETRRARVFAAKLGAVMIAVSVFTLLALLLLALLLVPSGAKHDTLANVGGPWWTATTSLFLRCIGIAALGGALGVGLAGLMRSSAGPIALWLVFRFVGSPLLTLWKPQWFRWLPEALVFQFLSASGQLDFGPTGGEFLPSPSVWRGGVLLLLYALIPVALSYGDFRTRDVT